jgi:predicted ArsR family transcriptional regulator
MTPTRWSRTRREQVLAILARAPWSSAADLAAETLLTEHSIRRLLGELEAAGKVTMRLESIRERDRRVAAWRATQAPWRAHPGGVHGRRFLYALAGEPTPAPQPNHPDIPHA